MKDKLIKYIPNMQVQDMALAGFTLLSFSMLIGLFVPKKLKGAVLLSCLCVSLSCLAAFATGLLNWEKTQKEEN